MSSILDTVYQDEMKIEPSRLQALVTSYLERQKTGVIRLSYQADRSLQLLFKRGELFQSYLVNASAYKILSLSQSMDHIKSSGDAYAKLVPLSPFGLFLVKLVIQARIGVNDLPVRQTQLYEKIQTAAQDSKIALAQLGWKNASGAVFFTGVPNECHTLFVSQDTVYDEYGINKIVYEWGEPVTSFVRHEIDPSVDAWQEYILRRLFIKICESLLMRFETMTGRALVDSLVRLVAVFASRQNLDISITSRRVIDREVFASPDGAAQTYRLLFTEMFAHFSAVIGPRLLSSTLNEIVNQLHESEKNILKQYLLFPEGYMIYG